MLKSILKFKQVTVLTQELVSLELREVLLIFLRSLLPVLNSQTLILQLQIPFSLMVTNHLPSKLTMIPSLLVDNTHGLDGRTSCLTHLCSTETLSLIWNQIRVDWELAITLLPLPQLPNSHHLSQIALLQEPEIHQLVFMD